MNWAGAGQAAVILLAVWWSWNYTTWATNELDTSAPAVRGLVIGVMLGSLLMSIAIPSAWGERALLFAGAYVAIQVGRHTFLTFASGTKGSNERARAGHILIWFCFSGIFWIAGGLVDGDPARTLLWLAALAIDYSAPLFVYRVPGMKRIAASAWDVASEHFSERFQLFVIIALGESIVDHRRDHLRVRRARSRSRSRHSSSPSSAARRSGGSTSTAPPTGWPAISRTPSIAPSWPATSTPTSTFS